MKAADLDYALPSELIAQRPLVRRDRSRLLVYERATGAARHRRFDELPGELAAGTLTVVNDTRVLPARLRLQRPGGGEAEVLLLERLSANGLWEGLARPSRRLRVGQRLGPAAKPPVREGGPVEGGRGGSPDSGASRAFG
jgi:S-adenosylmethionine:tRNA ribosyltransferase-isomerase